MAQDARISSRIDAKLKEDAEATLAELGIKPSQAIAMFYTQIVRQRGLPLELKLPNDETLEAMEELTNSETRATAPRFSSVEDLMKDLES